MKFQLLFRSLICATWAIAGCASQTPAKDVSTPVVSLAPPPSFTESPQPVADKAQPVNTKPLQGADEPENQAMASFVEGSAATGNVYGSGGLGLAGAAPNSDPLMGGVSGPTYVGNSIDKETIRRVIRAHINEVKKCYETALQRDPSLEGRVLLKFTIEKTGDVTAVVVQDSTLKDPSVGQCIVAGALKWKFPPHPGPGVIYISYPFVFKSA